ncbi:MAG: hypothetical protein IVW54_16765 [Candidatus Binataceae bacterium]|nr:hypothetical protein [Candidatus Binataceae bacterium]
MAGKTRRRYSRARYQGNPLKHAGRHHNRLARMVTAYARREGLHFGPISRERWDYHSAIADLIGDLMHLADRFKLDPNAALESGREHHTIETYEACRCGAAYDPDSTPERCAHCGGSMDLVSCAKCGGRVLRAKAIVDHGTGAEAGREFHYCSEHCKETH